MSKDEIRKIVLEEGKSPITVVEEFVDRVKTGEVLHFEDIRNELVDLVTIAQSSSEMISLGLGNAGNLSQLLTSFIDSLAQVFLEIDGVYQTGKTDQVASTINKARQLYTQLFQPNGGPSFAALLAHFYFVQFETEGEDGYPLGFLDEIRKDAEEHSKSILNLLEDLRQKTSEVGTAGYAKIYSDQALMYSRSPSLPPPVSIAARGARHRNDKSKWRLFILPLAPAQGFFVAGVLATGAAIAIAIWIGSASLESLTNLPVILKRVGLLSLALFASRFAFRHYSINKHLAVLYEQKAKALDSFPLLQNGIAGDDAATKNQILGEVARAIFENVDPGYVGAAKSDTGNQSLVNLRQLINPSKSQ